jgi:hypothetical protein
MKALLYTLLALITIAAEAVTGGLIYLVFQHPHRFAFLGGCGFVIGFILINAELLRWGIKYIKEQ